MDLRRAGLLLPAGGLRISWCPQRDDRRTCHHARGRHHVPILKPGRHGDMVPRAVPHEVPLHQPRPAHHLRTGACAMQLALYAHHLPAADVGAVLRGRHRQDTRHVREHVQHTTMDDTHTRHGRLLPRAACHTAHEHRSAGLVLGLLRTRNALVCLTLVCHRTHDARGVHTALSHTPVVPHAPARAAEGHRLARGCLLEPTGLADSLHLQLWRLARLVALANDTHAHRHVYLHPRRMPASHVDQAAAILRAQDVDLPTPRPGAAAHSRSGGDAGLRACA